MFSIVVVYSNERSLNEILLPSLKGQTVEFELIPIDNTKGQFKSAAAALNHGGSQARGDYVMFVHQDVELDSDLWLEKVEKILDAVPDLGIAGVAGVSKEGKQRGYISDSGRIWGTPLEKPEKVQTLDECLLIVPKKVFSRLEFDEKTFDDWHCYGSDYCLSVNEMGLQPYVIPAFIYHRSLRLDVKDLQKYQKRLYNKHRNDYKRIYTTGGEISWWKLKWGSLTNALVPSYRRLFPSWVERLKRELAGCDTVLDLGCGYDSPIRHCNVPFSVGVELFEPYLEESRKKTIHNQYIKADIVALELKPKCFDAVIAIEVVEHLRKEEGYRLIEKMETWAKKKVIITTPNEYLWQDACDDNPLQEHKSGWSVEGLRRLGFKVSGMNGWKKLRGCKGGVKYRPAFLWERVSDLSQKITFYYPRLAFQLFAAKQIRGMKSPLSEPLS